MSTSGTGPQYPLVPVVNLGNQYINGAKLTWNSTTLLTVNPGQVRDSTGTTDIIVGATQYANSVAESDSPANSVAVVVNTANTGAGGVDTGGGASITASKMYAVYVIGDSKGFQPGSAILSLSFTGVAGGLLLPLGYDCYRYVGAVSMDAAKHIRPFIQTGAQALRTTWYDPGTGPSTAGVVIPTSGTAGSTTYVNVGVLTSLIPPSVLEVLLNVAYTPEVAGNTIYFAPPTVDNGTTATVGSMADFSGVVAAVAQKTVVRVPVSLPNAAQIAALAIGNVVTAFYATAGTTPTEDAVVFLLNGYIDQL